VHYVGFIILICYDAHSAKYVLSFSRVVYSMYNEQTYVHLIDSLFHCSIFIAPTCFYANMSSSESSNSLPAKLHKLVSAVFVYYFAEYLIVGKECIIECGNCFT
jgi:hypothetical protein